jgi:hypothetical protein
MSSYYELPGIEPQRGTQAELERRLMARVAQVHWEWFMQPILLPFLSDTRRISGATVLLRGMQPSFPGLDTQEAQRRLRPVRLKVEFLADGGSNGEGSTHGGLGAAAALAVTAADAGNGAVVATGDAPNGRAPQAALQQALSHASGGSGGSASGSSQAPAPSSGYETSVLSRHVPGLRHITSRLPAGALPRVHLRHAVSRANPFRAVRSLSRHAEDSGASVQTVTYEVRCTGATHMVHPRHEGAALGMHALMHCVCSH